MASGTSMELSWMGAGVATTCPSRLGVKGGAQIVGAFVVGRQIAAEHAQFPAARRHPGGPTRRRISGTRNRTAQT